MRSPSQPLVRGHDNPVPQHADLAIYVWGRRIAGAIRVTHVARRHRHRRPDHCTGGRMGPPKPSSIGRCISHRLAAVPLLDGAPCYKKMTFYLVVLSLVFLSWIRLCNFGSLTWFILGISRNHYYAGFRMQVGRARRLSLFLITRRRSGGQGGCHFFVFILFAWWSVLGSCCSLPSWRPTALLLTSP